MSEFLSQWFDKIAILIKAIMAWLYQATSLELEKLNNFARAAIAMVPGLFNSAVTAVANFVRVVFGEWFPKVFNSVQAVFWWSAQTLRYGFGKLFESIKDCVFWLANKFNPEIAKNMPFLKPLVQGFGLLFMGYLSFWLGIGAIKSIQKKLKEEGPNNFQTEAKLDAELAAHSVVATGCFATSLVFTYKTAQALGSALAVQTPSFPDIIKSITTNIRP